jgi:hypothetical protein
MATDALRVVAQVVNSTLQTPPHIGRERDLRAIFYSEDADALWNEIYRFVQSSGISFTDNCETITQDLFLHLLTLKNNDSFAGCHYTNQELRLELFVCLQDLL